QTGSVVQVQSATGTAIQGCDPNYTNAAAIHGAIALVSRGTCTFQLKTINAQKAGAIGVILYDNRVEPPPGLGSDPSQPNPTIPPVSITQAAGVKLAAASGVNATLTAISAADTLASFSSRGPVGGGAFNGVTVLKPDVAAPGLHIPSTQSGMT